MMKKLLATSALISTVAFTNVSLAQTTITGSLDLTLRNTSNSVSGGAASETTMGRETQLNIANKGKLNNGLDYAAGFSLEFDGGQAAAESVGSTTNENVYINIISGGTTFHVGVDHIQNSGNDLLNSVGDMVDELTAVNGAIIDNVGFRSPKEDIGAGIVQNFGNGITASALYVPNSTNLGTGNNSGSATSTTGTNSAYEIGIRGSNVANSGISFDLWKNEIEKTVPADTRNVEGLGYSLNYNQGPFGVGAARYKNERAGTAASTTAAGTEVKTTMAHATYAIDKNLSASLVYAKSDDTDALSTADEKIKTLMVGYNFGPVGLLVTASKIDNLGARTANGDVDALGISLNTKF
jgi:hypothetical protein